MRNVVYYIIYIQLCNEQTFKYAKWRIIIKLINVILWETRDSIWQKNL